MIFSSDQPFAVMLLPDILNNTHTVAVATSTPLHAYIAMFIRSAGAACPLPFLVSPY